MPDSLFQKSIQNYQNAHLLSPHLPTSPTDDTYEQNDYSDMYALSMLPNLSMGMSAYPYSLSESPSMFTSAPFPEQHYPSMMNAAVHTQQIVPEEVVRNDCNETFTHSSIQHLAKTHPDVGTNHATTSNSVQSPEREETASSVMIHSSVHDFSLKSASSASEPETNKQDTHPQADPYAAAFLEKQLGEEKWTIFSTRYSERRLSNATSKLKLKIKSGNGEDTQQTDDKSGCANAVDFLVKVEIVKEALRTYVPHPYNPLKSLTHPFNEAPTGQVTLTRSTVLALSGWSNTQFSYWARRSEAISVLAKHDQRLRSVGASLESRLNALGNSAGQNPSSSAGSSDEGITGKGLDVIIDDVKQRTGASQFLRGKHSSLDPFGSVSREPDGSGNLPILSPVYNATFQAESYKHSPPALPGLSSRVRARKNSEGSRRSTLFESPTERSHIGSGLFSDGSPSPQTSITSPHIGEMSFLSPYSHPLRLHAERPAWNASRLDLGDICAQESYECADNRVTSSPTVSPRAVNSMSSSAPNEPVGVSPKRKRGTENEQIGRKTKSARKDG